ncbi:MAG: hypothetical protein NVSMB9_32500 [Isosphaeraceae bacterium]
MSHDRKERRRSNPRAFRPTLDETRLEVRLVMSRGHAPFVVDQYLLTHPQRSAAFAFNRPVQFSEHAPPVDGYGQHHQFNKGFVASQTARGGSSVIIAAPDGSRFRATLSFADNQFPPVLTTETGGGGTNVIPSNANVQPRGTVRAYGMPGGRVGLIVDGSTEQQQLTIDPLPFAQRRNYAHSFAYGEGGRSHILNIGSLNVTSGRIQAILGFHSADLSGPLTIGGPGIVDRVAFNSLLPGAAIGIGGTLNTLDIVNSITLTSGPGVSIGRDLNLFNAGGDIVLSNGANFVIGRDLGQLLQPPKGSGTGSSILSVNIPSVTNGIGTVNLQNPVGAYLQGNLTIGPGSSFVIGRTIVQQFRLLGNLNGYTRFRIGATTLTGPLAANIGVQGVAIP